MARWFSFLPRTLGNATERRGSLLDLIVSRIVRWLPIEETLMQYKQSTATSDLTRGGYSFAIVVPLALHSRAPCLPAYLLISSADSYALIVTIYERDPHVPSTCAEAALAARHCQ